MLNEFAMPDADRALLFRRVLEALDQVEAGVPFAALTSIASTTVAPLRSRIKPHEFAELSARVGALLSSTN